MHTSCRRWTVWFLGCWVSVACGAPEMAPTLQHALNGTNSVVYCPTLLMAWDRLAGIVGGPVQMQRADALVQRLNDSPCPDGVVPDEACVVLAGYTARGVVGELDDVLRVKFGAEAPAVPPIFMDKSTALVTYACLQRRLPFPRKFERSPNRVLRFGNGSHATYVLCFGFSENSAVAYAPHVQIVHYEGPDDFVLRLETKVANEFIVLAKMDKPASLLTGVTRVEKNLHAENKGFIEREINGKRELYMNMPDHGDVMAVPLVNLNVAANFPQLCNRNFINRGFEKIWLIQVYQDISFKLDESGAVVRSVAHAAAAGGSAKPRRFIFDKPFLITVWKKNAVQPYLAAWIAAPDMLVPYAGP